MALAELVERTLARVRTTPVDLALLPPESIPGSLFSGAAGVAFFLHEAARLRGEDDLLALACRWWEAGSKWADTASTGDWMELRPGFLIGASGLAYVDALLGVRLRDDARVLRAVENLERTSMSFDGFRGAFRPTELVGGHAGIVCATRDLEARLPGGGGYDASRAVLERVRRQSVATLVEAAAVPIPVDTAERRGLAHGLAGELWVLALCVGVDDERVSARLSELQAVAERDEDGLVYWLPMPGEVDVTMLGTWCNGLAGHSLLWSEVARQRGSEEAMGFAQQAAESVHVLLSLNASICCGLGGQSIALQRYADVSGDARFAKRAYARLARAAAQVDSSDGTYAMGFWQGSLGIALLAMARLEGERAFPCIEPLTPLP